MKPAKDKQAPLIGITAHRTPAQFGFFNQTVDLLTATFTDAVLDAGGQAIIIPTHAALNSTVIGRLDGLILSGGPDVDARLYGEDPHVLSETPNPERDAAELEALRAAEMYELPVLAICRGAQLLNVWRGGSLTQHLPDLGCHESHGANGEFATHSVTVAAGSWLAAAVGTRVMARCHHHQAVNTLGRDLEPVAYSNDGVIEGLELAGPLPMIGIQWHPEEVADDPLIPHFITTVRKMEQRRVASDSRVRLDGPVG